MNKQIVAVFLTLLMIGTIFVISPNKLKVQASSGGGNGFVLDHVYIYNKTKVLSKKGSILYKIIFENHSEG